MEEELNDEDMEEFIYDPNMADDDEDDDDDIIEEGSDEENEEEGEGNFGENSGDQDDS